MSRPRTAPGPRKYVTWSTKRKYEAAVRKVVHDGHTQTETAREFGISRPRLSEKVKAYRAKLEQEAALETEQAALSAGFSVGLGPQGLNERRRYPETFQAWHDHYLGHWRCPDCDKPHRREPYQDEIADAMLSDSHRVLVNLPPYHAKTTYGTVLPTLYDIGRNPNVRYILVSETGDFARKLLLQITQLMTQEELYLPDRNFVKDWGPFQPEGGSPAWNRSQVYVAGRISPEKDPTIMAIGVGAQIYGRRADKIRFDDCATTENQRNPDRVLRMMEWIDKEALSRIGQNGQATWIGTRVNAGDIYGPLGQRPGYHVIRYSCILDDTEQEVLWPDHFPYNAALVRRAEMTPTDWQLVYQNVDVPGLNATFTQEIIDPCKDTSRVVGQYESHWRLIAGLDPAGAGKNSGYTAFTLLGIDLRTGMRYLIDQVAVKAMKAYQLKEQMLRWSDEYPIYEWRVESNGVQANLVQYNHDIIRPLALKGQRVVPHNTQGTNKWDPQFGVESMAPLFHGGLISIPWGNAQTARHFQPWIEELVSFPMGVKSDLVMSSWFADLGCRSYLERGHLPMFNERMKVPNRVRRRRHVVDFSTREVRHIPPHEQRRHAIPGQRGQKRIVEGRPVPWDGIEEDPPPDRRRFVNVAGWVD